jgi:mRNA interferase RelE/StbE
MASYNVILKPSVEKDLRPLSPSVLKRVLKCIEALADDPFPHGSLKLAGAEQLYRIRVGEYRIVYTVAGGSRQVIVYYVRHRRDVYRSL